MKHVLIAAASLVHVASAQSVPDAPAIAREVTGVVDQGSPAAGTNAFFRRAHIPALRTTADGRIAVIVEGGNPYEPPGFTLMAPEQLTQPMLLDSPGPFARGNSFTVSRQGFVAFPVLTPPGMPVSHACLWDDAPPTTNAAGQDRYDLAVFVTSNYDLVNPPQPPQRRTQFFVTPVTILVNNPKTPNASIASVTAGTPVAGPPYPFEASGFEPVICGDGRLLVTRIFSSQIPWPPGSTTGTTSADIVYSYYDPALGGPADPTKWTELLPISHAPFDTRINTRFGFARSQFRDSAGTPIADGEDIGSSYPWIDREAKNLFFESVTDMLHYYRNGVWFGRYPQSGVPGDPWLAYGAEDSGAHQGVAFAGLWSHGKMVQLDTLNNDMDYAIGGPSNGPQQRLVTLFTPNSGPNGNEPAELQLGYGRATERMPLGENDNANIIDSLQNKFAYRKFMRPMTLRDVVWHVNNSKQTDEFVFDDYLDPDALVIANMNGATTMPPNPGASTGMNPLTHHSGWNTTFKDFRDEVWLQNAATAPTTQWAIPAYGLVLGPGRLEPAATGGVHGKGFWMDGATGVRFVVPANAGGAVASHDWYFGMFVDCRFADDTAERRLFTFPDGTSVRLYGRRQVLYADASGVIVQRITLPAIDTTPPASALDDLLPRTGWAHLAFQVRKGGTDVEFLLDGLPYSRWQHFTTSLFQPLAGNLTLGSPGGAGGFRGWIDDFKLFAHTVDAETACNHAGGTLIGLPAAYTGVWKTKFAQRYPAWTHARITADMTQHGEASHPLYACFHDYRTDNGTYAGNVPVGTVHLRQSVHFPEGPLFQNAPRPDTRANSFCISCHAASGLGGLGLGALAFNGVNAVNDARRQPSQPPATLFGAIPAALVETDTSSQPPTPMIAPPSGQPVDPWLLPSYAGPATLQSVSVLDGSTGEELDLLSFGKKLDPARYGTTKFQFRANLDSAQGSVQLSLDGSAVNPGFAPYLVPAVGVVLAAGQHTFSVMPQGAPMGTILDFQVLGGTKRTVADYRDDFQAGAVKKNWFYCWNAFAAMGASTSATALKQLNWHPGSSSFTELGLAYPESSTLLPLGALSATGGYPGRGSSQGATFDRFVLAGYQAKIGGYYGIDAGFVTSLNAASTGQQIAIYVQSGTTLTRKMLRSNPGGQTALLNNISLGLLAAGDIVWLGVGPSGNDTADTFSLDFSVVYNELFF